MAKSKSRKSPAGVQGARWSAASQRSTSTQKPPVAPASASRMAQQSSSAQKTSVAQRREEQRQRQQRTANEERSRARARNSSRGRRRTSRANPWLWVGVVVVVVAAIVGIFIYAANQSSNNASAERKPADPAVVNAVTHVSPSVLQTVGVGSVQNPPTQIKNQPPLTGPTGKPEFFYFGAEYCPYCAAQRWGVVVALSRFGTFSSLSETTSSATDIYPNTPTFSFYGSNYTSSYIDFVAVENQTNQPDGNGGYTLLQTPTAEQSQLVSKYDGPPYLPQSGVIPFIAIGNQYVLQGSSYLPDSLSGKTLQEIANSLSDPNSSIAKGILGTANYLTAAICTTTNQQPASVCQSAPIPTIEQTLNKTSSNLGGVQIGFVADTPAMRAKRRHLA